jgi:hypothetical protein
MRAWWTAGRGPLALAVAAAATLAIPASASAAKPTNGSYQGTVGDDPHETGTALVVSKRQRRVTFQEISSLRVTVEMLCDERFGQSISDASYTFRHLRIVKKRGRYTFSLSQRTLRGARRVTIRGVISGDVVAGTLRVDERHRPGSLDAFGRLQPRGRVGCTTDAQPFALPLVPGDLLAPSDAELEDGSLP